MRTIDSATTVLLCLLASCAADTSDVGGSARPTKDSASSSPRDGTDDDSAADPDVDDTGEAAPSADAEATDAGTGDAGLPSDDADAPPATDAPPVSGPVALPDLTTGTYKGFTGGLYPGASNVVPVAHDTAGRARAKLIRRLDTKGVADPSAGKIVLLSIGMSNTTMEFCSGSPKCGPPSGIDACSCSASSFVGQARAATGLAAGLVLVDGAISAQPATAWLSATAGTWDAVKNNRLSPAGLSEAQVQAIWLKTADAMPTASLPSTSADAYSLESHLGDILRAMRVRYPNLQQVFISSRIYAGYATSPLNPEPYAYESGFSAKWTIAAQIDQMAKGLIVDTRAGDLAYDKSAPWVAWGPYLWANGAPTWVKTDYGPDMTHPSMSGVTKVGGKLLGFFQTSAYTCWFRAAGC